MKVISHGGNTYDIFDDSLKVYEKLPPQVYAVRLSQQRGFFLEKCHDLDIKEKVYGVHNEKVEKVLSSFRRFDRNLGIILSGAKGIGKSLFAKMVAKSAINNGIAVIIVDTFYNGIASYIESIEDECVILFDEFDKTFGGIRAAEGTSDPQAQMLSLFDGLSTGKKMFIITCNNYSTLNGYLINRPGRFHYHFRFNAPNAKEIEEYLMDKIDEKYYDEIKNVVAFSGRTELNYDCLRAIAFELQSGLSFSEAISDLNIVNVCGESYNLTLRFKNGFVMTAKDIRLDLFNDTDTFETVYMCDKYGNNVCDVDFRASEASYDYGMMAYVINSKGVKIDILAPEGADKRIKSYVETYETIKSSDVECLIIRRNVSKDIHYTV